MTLRIETITVDSEDPLSLARFWSEALGWDWREDDDGDAWVEPGQDHPDQGAVRPLLFQGVPESKAVKNRLHLDLAPDNQASEVQRLCDLGAIRASVGQSGDEAWVVMVDPEGNEFCVLSSR